MRSLKIPCFPYRALVLFLSLPWPRVYAQEIQYKSQNPVDTSYVIIIMLWLFFLLALVALAVFMLKKYKWADRLKFTKNDLVDIKTSSHYSSGIKVHNIQYQGMEYLFVEKSNSLIQIDLSLGTKVKPATEDNTPPGDMQ